MYNTLKGLIDQYIIENTQGAITGEILNNVLNQMVSTLGSGSKFKGSIQPNSEAPSGTDGENDYFYIATTVGTYTNFGGVSVSEGELAFVKKEDSSWVKYSWNISSLLANKQDTINDLATIRSGASAGSTAYQKPQSGIPKTDLSSDVQASLNKADTAIQEHQDISGKADKSETYTKSEVDAKVVSVMRYKGSVNNYAALSAIQNPSVGDVYNVLDTGHNYAYDGTSWDVLSGIVSVDGKADKVSNATSGNFAGLDANGNLTDSGKKASDFATASQGAKADTAYQKPQTGIPASDLSSDVQSQLNKHFKGWFGSLEELKAAHTATEGDSAYVKDDSPATTWSIYTYDSTAITDNNWADSGTDADTSNVQTFASGEEVNETYIDETHLANPKIGALPFANDVMQLNAKLEGVTRKEVKAVGFQVADGFIACRNYTNTRVAGYYYTHATRKTAFVALGDSNAVRFLGIKVNSRNYINGYAYLNIDNISTFLEELTNSKDLTSYIIGGVRPFDADSSIVNAIEAFEIVAKNEAGANYIALFYDTDASSTFAVKDNNFYCYLQYGDNISDILVKKQYLNYTSELCEGVINGLIPRTSDKKFISSTAYSLLLFRLPAGTYTFKKRNNVSDYTIAAIVNDFDDVVANGYAEYNIIYSGASEIVEHFNEETLIVVLNRSGYFYNYYLDILPWKEYNASTNNDNLIDDLTRNTPVTTYQLANDLDWFTTRSFGYMNIAQYTKILNNDISFTKVRVNKILGNLGQEIVYRVYVTNMGKRQNRNCPSGVIGNASYYFEEIKRGSFYITNETDYSDYEILLDGVYTCKASYQVVVYMTSSSIISMRGVDNGSGNSQGTSNVSLYCSDDDPFGTSSWTKGSTSSSNPNTGYFNVALTLISETPFVFKSELQEEIEDNIEDAFSTELPQYIDDNISLNLGIVIPSTVYAIVGTELNIWNDTISLSIDKGLCSPMNYQIRWDCLKGLVTDRGFRFTPTASDVGNVTCKCYIYDIRGKFVSSKTFTIKVLAKDALSAVKNIVYFGDSLGDGVATALYDNFHDANRFGGVIPNMLGTKGTTKRYEAVGGYKWSSYATSGSVGYRIYVDNIGSIAVGAVYSDGSHNFEVYEVNITEGIGNCLLGKHYTNQGALIMPSGSLTKISGGGDATVAYTGAFQESVNPLWNDTTSQLDIVQYKQMLVDLGQLSSTSDKIDAVSFQFGINDNTLANDLPTLHTYISNLYNAFVGDNQDCKVIIGLTTSSGNDVNGAGANYGATWNYKSYLENTYKIRKYYLTLLSEFPNLRIATPNLSIDRYYGYGFGTRQISDRYTNTEQYHNNYLHPTTSGYNQMADAYLSAYVGVLSE